MLKPNYAWASRSPDDAAHRDRDGDGALAARQRHHQGLSASARPNDDKLPAVLVIHENRGLNPYIEDVARRLAVANFIAFAPDGLTSVGGYPGDDEKGAALFRQVDAAKMTEDFVAAAKWLKARPECTGKLGAIGFCFGGGIVNQLAVRLGADLDAAVPFYGAPAERRRHREDQGADQRAIRRTRHPHRQRLAGVRRRAQRGRRAARGLHLQGRQPRLPQRHDAALRRSGGQGGLGQRTLDWLNKYLRA